jgi:hypothetical protein
MMVGTGVNERFLLSAIADRLVFGDAKTFSRDDARELARLMPVTAGSGFLSRIRPELVVQSSLPGRSTSAFAAGVGSTRLDGDEVKLDFDSRRRRVVRAGQWKLFRKGRTIEIEQVMADDSDDGRTARLDFSRGEPVRMCLLKTVEFGIGPLVFATGWFQPWKEPV